MVALSHFFPICCRDGRIKVIGGDNIEGLFISPKQLPYKYLEFLQNQGFLVSISNDDEIQCASSSSFSLFNNIAVSLVP
ncbi:hypothetical protein CK203_081273 [Vitis vinifera]|uniref:Uncharacterized protein n=1 Tax=Vitis vinifera TaxID=29760 RepID=A0A438DAH9_VITVI|nr:hypothetical protein CK203_081273 [Vitis vinifera]